MTNYRQEIKMFEKDKNGNRVLLAIIDAITLQTFKKCLLIIHPSVTQPVVKFLKGIF